MGNCSTKKNEGLGDMLLEHYRESEKLINYEVIDNDSYEKQKKTNNDKKTQEREYILNQIKDRKYNDQWERINRLVYNPNNSNINYHFIDHSNYYRLNEKDNWFIDESYDFFKMSYYEEITIGGTLKKRIYALITDIALYIEVNLISNKVHFSLIGRKVGDLKRVYPIIDSCSRNLCFNELSKKDISTRHFYIHDGYITFRSEYICEDDQYINYYFNL